MSRRGRANAIADVSETNTIQLRPPEYLKILQFARDENRFRHAWNSSNTPPRRSTTNAARIGKAVSALLIFHGCSPNAHGVCDVESEFMIESPDGSKTPAGGGPVWNGKPVPPQRMQLGQASLTLGFDKNDPVGEYKVVANIKDKVSGQALSVLARLKIMK